MGRELLLTSLAIPKGKEPDWNKAQESIEELIKSKGCITAYFDVNGEEPQDEDTLRTWLTDLITHAKDIWKDGWRDSYVTENIVPGWKVWVAGGDSWGDSPCDEFDLINNLLDTGLAEKAGFVVEGY